jgi:hypothetical protein
MHKPLRRGALRSARSPGAVLSRFSILVLGVAACTADHGDLFASTQPGVLPSDGGGTTGPGSGPGGAPTGEAQDAADPDVRSDAWNDDGAGGGASEAGPSTADALAESGPIVETDATVDPGEPDALVVDAAVDLGSVVVVDAGPVEAGPDASFDCDAVHGTLFEGHCYFSIEANGWAADACDSHGAHLASIASEDEQRAVQKVDPGQDRWIGLRRPPNSPQSVNSFVWTTGEPLSYSNWASYGGNNREPNYTGQCVRLLPANTWADNDCTDRFPILCEHE